MRLFVARYLAGAIFYSVLSIPQQAMAHLFENASWVAHSIYMMPQKSNSSIGIGGLRLQSNLYSNSASFRPSQEDRLYSKSDSLDLSPMSVNLLIDYVALAPDSLTHLLKPLKLRYEFPSFEAFVSDSPRWLYGESSFLKMNQAIFFNDFRKS